MHIVLILNLSDGYSWCYQGLNPQSRSVHLHVTIRDTISIEGWHVIIRKWPLTKVDNTIEEGHAPCTLKTFL